MHMNCLIDVEMYNKIPIGVNEWKVLKTTKWVSYWVRTLTTGDFIVSSEEIRDAKQLCSTVISVHVSEVFYINREPLIRIFEWFKNEKLWQKLNKFSP